MALGGILGGGGGLGGLFGGGGNGGGKAGEGDEEQKVSFSQVYNKAVPGYLTGRECYSGDETTQRYYKQLKALNKSEANSCTVLSYEA
jgi:hypothetical protein